MSEPTHTQPALVRTLTLRDLVLFNIVAVLGLRWLATSAKAGPSAITLWLFAAVFFFIPQGFAVVELSNRFPHEGGIYLWAKKTFGEGHGFLCGWCYWICNVMYYPNLLISTAVIATYVVGKGGTSLEQNWTYVLTTTLVCLWLAVALNIVGLGTGKWLQNLGGLGTYIPGVLVILVGLVAIMHHGPANPMPNARAFIPDVTNLDTLNLWASIAFAFAGLELSATMGDEIAGDPQKSLRRAILIAAPLVALAYILGTVALLWIVPTGSMNIVSGFLQAITIGGKEIGPWLWWVGPFAAAAYTIGNIGGVGAWLTGPARVAFVIGLDRYFPPAFGKVHPKWRTPYVAILVMAGLATVFLLISVLGKGTTVEKAYLVLLDTQLLIYFIPYLYLFGAFIVQRSRGGADAYRVMKSDGLAYLIGVCGLLVTAFAMLVAAIPPSDTPAGPFLAKVVGGASAFIALGGVIYWLGRNRVPSSA